MKTEAGEMLARYFSGELSPLEQQQVLDWANRHRDNRFAFEQANRIWAAAQELPTPDPDTKNQWESLQKSMETKSVFASQTKRLGYFKGAIYWAAAVVVLLIGIGFSYWPKPALPVAVKEVASLIEYTTTDSTRVFYLPDSSQIWLNHHSKVTFTKDYGHSERRVRLKGQAFFEVRRNPSHPFFVQTDVTQTRVLGTSFDVKAYEGQPTVEVIVASGKVAFYHNNDTLHQRILLYPSEMGIFQREQGLISKTKTDHVSQRLAWRLLNNSRYQLEMKHPARFLKLSSKWRKNALNQTVLEGSIRNNASLTTYTDIRIHYTVFTRSGKEKSNYFTLHEVIAPGKTITYKRSMLDMLTRSSQVSVEVVETQATSKSKK
jgi:ferric-dicitrate binding protein FerR (iron transport regulator)